MKLSIKQIVEKSETRSDRWHGGDMNNWSALEWAGAMCGEAGEAANAAKKLKRLEDGIATKNEADRRYETLFEAREAVGKEVADTILYAVLLASRVGVDIEKILAEVFNKKSEEYGFPERLITETEY